MPSLAAHEYMPRNMTFNMPTLSSIPDMFQVHPFVMLAFSLLFLYMLASVNMSYIRELERQVDEQEERIERLKANGPIGPTPAVRKDSVKKVILQKNNTRKSARLEAKRQKYVGELLAKVNAGLAESCKSKRVDLIVKYLDYVYENIGPIELLVCSTRPNFRNTLIKKCREYQQDTDYPNVVEAATRILDWYGA